MTVEIRLIGSPDEVRGLTEWFEAAGLSFQAAADRPAYSAEGNIRRYITAESPTTFPQNLLGESTKLTLTSHPGDGNGHPPAILIRGQAGAVVVAADRVGVLCEALRGLAESLATQPVPVLQPALPLKNGRRRQSRKDGQ